MDDVELLKLRTTWYSSPEPLFEIVKNMVGREVIFLEGKTKLPLLTKNASPVRMVKAHALHYLQSNFGAFAFIEKPYNIYQSIASFENLPMASFNPAQRKIDQDQFFHGVAFDLCFKKYDLFIDIDAQKIEGRGNIGDINAIDVNEKVREFYAIDEMYSDAKRLKKILTDFGLAFSVKFSGLKGFHFGVKDENFFPTNMKPHDKVLLAKKIADELKAIEDIPTIDDTIYQATRIQKSAYSLDGYNVALPLTNEEFDSWSLDKMRLDFVLKNISIRNRGLLERPKQKDPQEFIGFYGSE